MSINHHNVPALRFSEFTEEWHKCKLGQVCKFEQGVQIDLELQKFEPRDGLLKFIRIENLTQNSQDYRYIDASLAPKKRITKDEVAIVRYGATAGFIGYGLEGVLANNLFKVVPEKNLLNLYIYFYLNGDKPNKYMQDMMAGGAMPALSFSIMRDLNFAFPSLPEQQKIASFLTAIYTKIELLFQKKTLLEQYKKGVMQQLFSQQIRFKDDEGNEFPEWEEKTLGDVTEIIMGQSPESESYNTESKGMPLIQGNADIQDRVSNPRNWTSQPTKTCKTGDLLLTVRAPVGAVAKSIHAACIGRGICVVRNNPKTNHEFLYQFLLDHESKWSSIEQGSTFTAVSGNEIRKLKINFPSLSEQIKIADLLTVIDKKIHLITTQIEATKSFKKGLLQQLFV